MSCTSGMRREECCEAHSDDRCLLLRVAHGTAGISNAAPRRFTVRRWFKTRFIRCFGGESNERYAVRRFHPEGMPAISSLLNKDCWEGEAPAEPQETSDIPHTSGSAGASPSLFQQAVSRGLSVCDTPGAKPTTGDWHPEGMLASSECLPVPRGWHPFRMQPSFVQPLPGVSLRSTPGESLASLQDEDLEHLHLLSYEDSPKTSDEPKTTFRFPFWFPSPRLRGELLENRGLTLDAPPSPALPAEGREERGRLFRSEPSVTCHGPAYVVVT